MAQVLTVYLTPLAWGWPYLTPYVNECTLESCPLRPQCLYLLRDCHRKEGERCLCNLKILRLGFDAGEEEGLGEKEWLIQRLLSTHSHWKWLISRESPRLAWLGEGLGVPGM